MALSLVDGILVAFSNVVDIDMGKLGVVLVEFFYLE